MDGGRQPGSITVLGLDIAFKPGADMGRAQQAARHVEERYQKLRAGGSQARDALLLFVALGLADELLQMKHKQEQADSRLECLLEKIEQSLRE